MNETPLAENVKPLTVSELTRQIKGMLEEEFGTVWVSGEISSLSRPRSGHLYFNLKDAEACLRAVIWRGIALRLRFDPSDGMEVIARGRLSIYPPQGNYQLVIEEMQPKGVGALELALRQLREKLFLKGYFDPKRKKPLPRLPRRIALVTSPTGAAVRDMVQILSRRWPLSEIWVCPVTVQGEGAALDIAAMIQRLNRIKARVDVIIVGRGGGSLEDLWAFNEEPVAQAIFESRIPVVSAVGHEVDNTIADAVADKRAATPSEAAELVVPSREEELERLLKTEVRLRELLLRRWKTALQRWNDISQRRAFRLPLERVHDLERRLDDWEVRLQRAVRRRVQLSQKLTEALAAQLESLSPLNVLSRGYSLTRDMKHHIIIQAADVQPGDVVETLLHKGRLISRVEEVQPEP